VASGSLGAEPSRKSQPVSALVLVKGQLATPEEFRARHPPPITSRSNWAKDSSTFINAYQHRRGDFVATR
jgi:hypothetical protein